MIVNMGRPKEHDEETRAALRAATERVVSEFGVGAFSVRAVAREVGTTTRAVYSLFGSKEGLLVDAMAQTAYAFLADEMDALVRLYTARVVVPTSRATPRTEKAPTPNSLTTRSVAARSAARVSEVAPRYGRYLRIRPRLRATGCQIRKPASDPGVDLEVRLPAGVAHGGVDVVAHLLE